MVPDPHARRVLQTVIEETAAPVGDAFFRSLVSSLAFTLGVGFAFVGELIGEKRNRLRTHALWLNGGLAENIEYDLAGTPCENVLSHNGIWNIPQGMKDRFPPLGVESYLGLRVTGVSGNVIGLIGVMDNEPMTDSDMVGWTLVNVAARAGAEMERSQVSRAREEMAAFGELNPAPVLRMDHDGIVQLANQATLERFKDQRVIGASWFALCSDIAPATYAEWSQAGPDTLQHEAHLGKESFLCTYRKHHDGTVHVYAMDITARKRAEALVVGQKSVLESIAIGAPLPDILNQLCVAVEQLSQEMLCSILILEGTMLQFGAAPSLPKAYSKAIDGLVLGPNVGSCGTAAYHNKPVIVEDIATDPRWEDFRSLALGHGLRACWSVPITSSCGMVLGTCAQYYRKPRSYSPEEFKLVESTAHLAGIAIERTRSEQEIVRLRDQLKAENTYLREELSAVYTTDHIIGHSPTIKHILSQISLVASTDSTVLIQGETGTGKELLARAIHAQSHRKDRPLITINCASVPSNLIESELFGHKRGSFTGATENRIGRFELAEGGTIFLDEVSELPLETQAKLLRVLQEREFERVGESTPVKLETRFIAASNLPLEAAIGMGTFRKDLFYRLNVFPIEIPPLRHRQEDLSELAMHFVQRFNRTMGKRISTIDQDTLGRWMTYAWPGNIRELENVIERAMILSQGPVLLADTPPSHTSQTVAYIGGVPTHWETHERSYLQKTVEQTGGVIYGPQGAAHLLGMNPSTLRSRLKRLGIQGAGKHRPSSMTSETSPL